MATFNGNRVTQRGGADAGRGDNPHGVTKVNLYSAKTRKEGHGKQTSMDVSTGDQGGDMSNVRGKYRQMRKAGLSPDASRASALNPYGHSAENRPNIQMSTDASGNAWEKDTKNY